MTDWGYLRAPPGGYTGNPGVQKGLILRGFLEAVLNWRRGRDSHPLVLEAGRSRDSTPTSLRVKRKAS